jgi:hypothetical protein
MDQEQVMPAELAEQFIEFDQCFGNDIGVIVSIILIVDGTHRSFRSIKICRAIASPDFGWHLQQDTKTGRLLSAPVTELQPYLLIFLGRHCFQQIELRNHQSQDTVAPAK